MPFLKVKNDGGEVCVYKRGSDGKPEGKTFGCHPSDEEADEQIAALYASEKSVSLGEQVNKIREMLDDVLFPREPSPEMRPDGWIEEVYPDFVIVNQDGKYYKVGYSVAENSVSVSEKIEVEKDWKPVMKALWTAPTEDETIVEIGDSIKALGNNKLGGYLVRFSTANDPDLTGDFFTKDTDFDVEFPSKATVYYNHGLDETMKKRKLGKADIKLDDAGIWAEIQLQARDEYEKMIGELGASGKLGWSSGTAGHLIEKEVVGKAAWIKMWPLIDASLTPTPAEPRNQVMPLKSLLGDYQALKQTPETVPSAVAEKEKPQEIKLEKIEMDENEIKTLVESSVKEASEKAASEAAAKAIDAYKAALPAIPEGGVAVVPDKDEKPFKSFGEQLQAVMGVATRNVTEEQVNKLEAVKATGMNEGVSSEGGFLVQTDYSAELLKPIYELGEIASRVDKTPVSANSNGMKFNAVDESSRATGSRYGAVQAYWLNEGGTKTPSELKFRQIKLELKKLIGLCYATDELLQDAVALESVVREGFANEFTFMVEDAAYNGDGVGKPLGVMNSGCLVSVAKESGQAADTILAENIFKMWSRMAAPFRKDAVWHINQDLEPQLFSMYLAVGTGGVPVYLPANGLSGSPYGTLMGRPVVPVEYAATLGDKGDIMLANWKAYKMIDKGGMQSASSIHVNFTTDETAFRFVYRCDGQPKWASDLTPFKGSNTVSPFVTLDARA